MSCVPVLFYCLQYYRHKTKALITSCFVWHWGHQLLSLFGAYTTSGTPEPRRLSLDLSLHFWTHVEPAIKRYRTFSNTLLSSKSWSREGEKSPHFLPYFICQGQVEYQQSTRIDMTKALITSCFIWHWGHQLLSLLGADTTAGTPEPQRLSLDLLLQFWTRVEPAIKRNHSFSNTLLSSKSWSW